MIESKPAQFKDRPYIGVGVMVWSGNKLLLGQRKNSQDEGSWQFPGGHLETGETILECARREVDEEAGIQIGDIFHAGFTGNVFKRNGRQYVTLFVSAKYISGDAKVLEPEKCKCWKWFPYNELPSPLFLPITNLLEQVPHLGIFRDVPDIQAGVHR
jgi:8-oxo-dGTP diphosphatase